MHRLEQAGVWQWYITFGLQLVNGVLYYRQCRQNMLRTVLLRRAHTQ
jgi:hypothetical protein